MLRWKWRQRLYCKWWNCARILLRSCSCKAVSETFSYRLQERCKNHLDIICSRYQIWRPYTFWITGTEFIHLLIANQPNLLFLQLVISLMGTHLANRIRSTEDWYNAVVIQVELKFQVIIIFIYDLLNIIVSNLNFNIFDPC